MTTVTKDPVAGIAIGCAIEVHRTLGPGLLESAYDRCLAHELAARGIEFRHEVAVPIEYKNQTIQCGFRVDFVVGNSLLVELKAVERIPPIHQAQVMTYAKLLKVNHALLINFNVTRLVDGLKSFLL